MNKIQEFWRAVKRHYKLVYSWFDSEDEWHDLYDRGSLNGGQGPRRDER